MLITVPNIIPYVKIIKNLVFDFRFEYNTNMIDKGRKIAVNALVRIDNAYDIEDK
tara:strand:- start:3 stop:167 length:165 start_codon:yes stop_codon:yes gene_type:complete